MLHILIKHEYSTQHFTASRICHCLKIISSFDHTLTSDSNDKILLNELIMILKISKQS